MLFPDGEGTIAPVEGDGVLGLFLLPNSLFGRRAMSLLPLLPLACLLKLSTYGDNNQFGPVLKIAALTIILQMCNVSRPGSCLGVQPKLPDGVCKVCHFHRQYNCLVVPTAGASRNHVKTNLMQSHNPGVCRKANAVVVYL